MSEVGGHPQWWEPRRRHLRVRVRQERQHRKAREEAGCAEHPCWSPRLRCEESLEGPTSSAGRAAHRQQSPSVWALRCEAEGGNGSGREHRQESEAFLLFLVSHLSRCLVRGEAKEVGDTA